MLLLEPIRFTAPVRDICLSGELPPEVWTARLQAAERTGYERGLIDGERTLSEQLVQQRQELAELHRAAVTSLQQTVPQVARQMQDTLVALALQIAQRLVGEIPITREMVVSAVGEALEEIEDTTELKVLLHPDDLALLGSEPALTIPAHPTGSQVSFVGSRDVSRGGCIVQTRFGTIDNRRETKLALLNQALETS